MCMNKIKVPYTKAWDAIVWASEQFGNGGYTIVSGFPGKMYEFTFERPDQAALFALKWM